MIEVAGLTKRYGERLAIRGLTFNAKRGEVVGFLGPNGAGKTTTMRILTGYMPPTSGEAHVAGYDLLTQSLEVRKRVGYVPENVPLYPEMTVVSYLDFMAELRRLPKRQDRVDTVMELVHIDGRAESYIGNLSKGLRQRVGLAQALLHEPEVLILDEPMEGLDPQQQLGVKQLIRDLGREHTVMLSTHILAHAQELCDRVIIIHQGQIVAEDTPERLGAQLAGGGTLRLLVAGDSDGLLPELQRLPGVSGVRAEPDGRYTLDLAPGEDARPRIAEAVVRGGWQLLEMRRERLSLEEIFITLTQEQAAAQQAQGEAAGRLPGEAPEEAGEADHA